MASTFTDLRLRRGPRRNETTRRADLVKGLLATRMEGSKVASACSQARPTSNVIHSTGVPGATATLLLYAKQFLRE